jgi:pantoate--beta-alanine ligase
MSRRFVIGGMSTTTMKTLERIDQARREIQSARTQARQAGGQCVVAFVPTMGYLHDGHVALIREARRLADEGSRPGRDATAHPARGLVVVSLYVNPAQFGPNEDLSRYPRDLPRDQRLAAEAGADQLWTPTTGQIYPAGFGTTVATGPAGQVMCGADRPTHFDGVATVVLKLFTVVMPDVALFGWKDAQQFLLLQRMVRDFHLPIAMVGVETVREADGLAMSSRNVFLSAEERAEASALQRALRAAAERLEGGATTAEALATFDRVVAKAPLLRVVYREVRSQSALAPLESAVPGDTLIAAAARVGRTRLIDNVRL